MKKLLLLLCATFFSLSARVIVFDIHGVLLHENLANFVKGKVQEALSLQNDRGITDNPLFKKLCQLMAHYRPLGEPTADYPQDCPLPYETFVLFNGKEQPEVVHIALLTMMEKARNEKLVDAMSDLLLTTLINAIFDRENFTKTMVPLFEGIALFKTLAQNKEHTVYVYSNAPQAWIDLYHSIFPEIFSLIPRDHIFSSGGTGYLKPATESYQTIATHAGVNLQDLLLIDDTQHNIDGALKLGMHDSFQFTTENFITIIMQLVEKGILSSNESRSLQTAERTTTAFGERCLFF